MKKLSILLALLRPFKSFIYETWLLILYALLVFGFKFLKPDLDQIMLTLFPILSKLGIEHIQLQLFYMLCWLTILFLLTLIYICKKPHIELRSIISSALTGSFPSFAAFVSMVLFIIFTSWLADDLRNATNSIGIINATLDVIYTLGLLPAFALSIPEYKPKSGSSTKPEPKKVLISALSDPRSGDEVFSELKSKFKEAYLQSSFEEAEEILKGLKMNWIPLLRSYLFHKKKQTIEILYVLISNESGRFKDKFKEIIDNKTPVQFSEKVDFNDYDAIHIELLKILKDIRRNGYTDEDISVFISGGTSAVTLALTMFALKEGRQVEYVKQDESKDIVKIDIGLIDLYSFAPELRG